MAGSTVVDVQGRVAEIVGENNLTKDPASLACYFAEKVDPGGLAAACPGSTEEVQRIVEVCSASAAPVIAMTIPWSSITVTAGFIPSMKAQPAFRLWICWAAK